MKIAIVSETFLPSTDGVVTRLTASIDWLQKQGHELLIIAPDLGVKEYRGIQVVGLPAHRFFLYPDRQLSWPSRQVGKSLRMFHPDLVHVVNPAVLGVAGVYYSWKWNYPLVASYHTRIPQYADYYGLPFFKPVLWWYFRLLHNRADLNLCTSQTVCEELTAKRFRNVHVWKRGVDIERFGPQHYDEEMRHRLTGGQTEKTLLLYVGRLAPEKEIGQIRDVLQTHPDMCLAIVGDGPERQLLEDHFKGMNVVFTGFLHGQELAQAYASSDVFVFPSTTETLGLVILEAMASGLPVVAARSGPSCEQIEDGVTGCLFDPEEKGSLSKAVLKLNDHRYREQISRNAYEVGRQFGWAEPSAQLLHFYQQVLEKRLVSTNNLDNRRMNG